jgi:small subunit ribosomal protein S7
MVEQLLMKLDCVYKRYPNEFELTEQEERKKQIKKKIRDGSYQLSPLEFVSSKAPSNYCDILSYIGKCSGEKKELIKKLVNFRMISGKRRRVRAIFDQTFHRSARSEGDVIELLVKAVENIKPICEVEKVKRAGTTYDVPSIVGRDRQQSLAIRWILEGAEEGRISKSTSLEKSSFSEIVDAYRQRGIAHMKRQNLHRLASAKVRAFQMAYPYRSQRFTRCY